MSAHAEFWLVVMEPDSQKRITLANMWLEQWVEDFSVRVHVDAYMEKLASESLWPRLLEEAQRNLALALVQRAAQMSDEKPDVYSGSTYRQIDVTAIRGPAPRRFRPPGLGY